MPESAHVGFAADGDVARVVGEDLVSIRFQGGADEAQGGRLPERIDEAGGQVGDQHHVARFDALQPHRRAIEADAAFQDIRVELAGGHGQMVPATPQVAEFQIDHLDVVLINILCRLVEDFKHGIPPTSGN